MTATTTTPERRGPGRPRKVQELTDPTEMGTEEGIPTPAAIAQELHDTGTPIRVVRLLRGWIDANPEADAKALYLHMDELEKTGAVNVGTLRKAGKLVHGNSFEPERLAKDAPADELARLREENDRLNETVAELRARALGLTNQVQHLQERLNDSTRTISFLKIGKSPEDLAAAGLNAPVADQ